MEGSQVVQGEGEGCHVALVPAPALGHLFQDAQRGVQRTPAFISRPASEMKEGFHESRRCSRDTYPESHITKYTSIR